MASMLATVLAITPAAWVTAGATAVLTLCIVFLVRRVIRKLARRLRIQRHIADLGIRLIAIVILAVGGYVVLTILGIKLGPLLGALGVSSIVLAFALQSLLTNLVSGLLLEAHRPFNVGDQIETNDYRGTVIDISSRAVTILTYDGTHVHLPNTEVLDNPIENFTQDAIRRTTLPVQVPYEVDLVLAGRTMSRAMREIFDVEDNPSPDALVTGFGESGVDFVLRFWHASEEITAQLVISEVLMAVHRDLLAEGIEIPYPQQVIHVAPDKPTGSGLGQSKLRQPAPEQLMTPAQAAEKLKR